MLLLQKIGNAARFVISSFVLTIDTENNKSKSVDISRTYGL